MHSDNATKKRGLEQERSFNLVERACIRPTEVFGVLDTLSSTVIFNTANHEERLALASRLRHWVVEDGAYLIREGDGDRNRSAVFMIGTIILYSVFKQWRTRCVYFAPLQKYCTHAVLKLLFLVWDCSDILC